MVILSPCDRATLQQIACRIRAEVEKESRRTGTPVTISVGACYCLPGEDMDTILRHTDKALYEAKNQGRNRVCIQTENGPEIHPV
ncbi:diguanylate cyclase (GGDEF) domain-containing protein [Marinobacter persicus]|uniref:diguanylate cyclase n=1 Tax=Marinobacter persicus TaxID=930118 RepID=A0A1I3XQ52_9GAMM|nr:diguanylate cyclase (GGDEF) domain-containing protein [Marinobacter persicus]